MASRSDKVTVDLADEERHAALRERSAKRGFVYRRVRLEDVERRHQEMLTQLAPADTGPVSEPRRPVRGRIVHGDDET
jgi:hypothetical protein